MAEEAREESVQERLANPQPASEKFAEPRPDVSARDAVAPGDPPSAAHALISGLRLTGDEAQFTQVIAAVARADPGFAGWTRGADLEDGEQGGNRCGKREDDVPRRLLELVEENGGLIVRSGILDGDVTMTVERNRSGPPRLRSLPTYEDE